MASYEIPGGGTANRFFDKLRKVEVSFSIKLAAIQTSGGAER
jgi:hypothetical protein